MLSDLLHQSVNFTPGPVAVEIGFTRGISKVMQLGQTCSSCCETNECESNLIASQRNALRLCPEHVIELSRPITVRRRRAQQLFLFQRQRVRAVTSRLFDSEKVSLQR